MSLRHRRYDPLSRVIADIKLQELLEYSLTLEQAEKESKKGAFVYLIVFVGNEDEDEGEDDSTAVIAESTAASAARLARLRFPLSQGLHRA